MYSEEYRYVATYAGGGAFRLELQLEEEDSAGQLYRVMFSQPGWTFTLRAYFLRITTIEFRNCLQNICDSNTVSLLSHDEDVTLLVRQSSTNPSRLVIRLTAQGGGNLGEVMTTSQSWRFPTFDSGNMEIDACECQSISDFLQRCLNEAESNSNIRTRI